jgi:hypothetical protein
VNVIDRLFDLLTVPLASQPALAMTVVSVLTAVWSLLLFKLVTPQRRLVAARDQLTGHLLELGLYQDHLRVVGRIQRDLARANLRYLALTLPALLVLGLPMALTLIELDGRFAVRPLQPGETTVVSAQLTPAQGARLQELELVAPPGLRVEAGPVRDATTASAAWRLHAETPGRHELSLRLAGQEIASRNLPVGTGLMRLVETVRPRGASVSALSIQWPERRTRYLGLELHWLAAFSILALLAGLALKNVLRVSL